MIHREMQLTADGSHTLYIPEMEEHYHSVNGAIQESRHIFIHAGVKHLPAKEHLRILEIGFGTGLNALLTLLETDIPIEYFTIERYPLPAEIVSSLNYADIVCPDRKGLFAALHTATWNTAVSITDRFTLYKIQADSNTCLFPEGIDIVYYDAFAPDKQPEMWTPDIFAKLYEATTGGGILVTYCAKGSVRRMMKEAGYSVERIPGPPGKREMLRATK